MKKYITLFLTLTVVISLFSGCADKKQSTDTKNGKSEQNVSASVDKTAFEEVSTTAAEKKTDKNDSSEKDTKSAESKKLTENFTKEGKAIINSFAGMKSYDKVLDDLADINISSMPDLSGKKYTVKKETVTDPEDDDKTITKYYDGNTLVYQKTDTMWDHSISHFTATKSGEKATVNYYDEGGLDSVIIESGNYRVRYAEFNKNSPYGAENISVTVTKPVKGSIDEIIYYEISEKQVVLASAKYFGNGEYKWYTSYFNVDKKLEEYSEDLFKPCTAAVSTDVIKQITSVTEPIILQSLMGPHKLSFKQNGSSKDWFITCDLYVVFSSEADAKAFAQKYSAGSPEISQDKAVDETTYYALYKNVTMPISKSFKLSNGKDFGAFAYSEFEDYSFTNIEIDSNNELAGISYDNSLLSCY